MTDDNKNIILDKYENYEYLVRLFSPLIFTFVGIIIWILISYFPMALSDKNAEFGRNVAFMLLGSGSGTYGLIKKK